MVLKFPHLVLSNFRFQKGIICILSAEATATTILTTAPIAIRSAIDFTTTLLTKIITGITTITKTTIHLWVTTAFTRTTLPLPETIKTMTRTHNRSMITGTQTFITDTRVIKRTNSVISWATTHITKTTTAMIRVHHSLIVNMHLESEKSIFCFSILTPVKIIRGRATRWLWLHISFLFV
jgi:hypothetical protein